jgi:hypothetical protein
MVQVRAAGGERREAEQEEAAGQGVYGIVRRQLETKVPGRCYSDLMLTAPVLPL